MQKAYKSLPPNIIKRYYKPIINKFPIENFQQNKVNLDDFIQWYETFKKSYSSANNILSALKFLNFQHYDDFKLYLHNIQHSENQDYILYKKCVKLGYRNTLKNMKSFINILKDYDKDKITYEDALKLCINTKDSYLLIDNKIIVMEILNFNDNIIKFLKKEKILRDNRIVFLREVADETKIRIKYIKEIDIHVNGINNIPLKSTDELLSLLTSYKNKRNIMKVFEYIIKDDSIIQNLNKKIPYNFTKFNKIEFFFMNRPSHTLRNLFTEIIDNIKITLTNSSAYVEDRIKDIELRFIHFLDFLHNYLKKNNFHPPPPLSTQQDQDIIIYFLQNSDNKDIYNLLLDYGENCNYDNSKVKSKVSKHHQSRQNLNHAIKFLKHISPLICNKDCCNYITSLKSSIFLSIIENKSELLNWDNRRVYTDEEIDAMLKECDNNIKDKLMITILREIGLRNSAICNLKFKDIIDDYRLPKHICRVKEKGNKIREFINSQNIKKLIVSYIHKIELDFGIKQDIMNKFVFSRSPNLNSKLASSTLNSILKKIAIRAGVTDINVQAHTFRHTLVGKLMDAGNKIETVSKFIGHNSVDTTMTYYWIKNIEQLANEINNPFTQTILSPEEIKDEHETEIELLNKKIDTCFQIIGIYKNEINNADSLSSLNSSLEKHSFIINKTLRYIAESSCHSDNLSIMESL